MHAKRVFSIIRGGIGNQMFIYAASRRIAQRNNAKLYLITDSFENEPHGRQFLLNRFSITADTVSINDKTLPYSVTKHDLARKLDRQLYAINRHAPHYLIERTKNYLGKRVPVDRRVLAAKIDDYLFIDGYLQNELYFSDIRDVIRAEFQLRNEPNKPTRDISRRINASNSVCIHFRRTELEQKQMLAKHGNTHWMGGYKQGLGIDFYMQAIKMVENNVPSPEYYCFSDHPDWARENLDLGVPVNYVTENNTQNTCHEDIYLMSQCKHHIISHSTFGWWGAWLAGNPDKIVIAPENICSRPKPPDYPDSWKTIRVCQEKVS